MSINTTTPWHTESFIRFQNDLLPQLLAERLPLLGYKMDPTGHYTWDVEIVLGSSNGDLTLAFTNLPQPDESGVFNIEGDLTLVVPVASQEALEQADIQCVGELLYGTIHERLGEATSDLPWDAEMARAWVPLESWINEFLLKNSQKLDTTNWLSRRTHLRRILLTEWKQVVTPGQLGRVCPFEMPEGPNLGRVFTVATGAAIQEGKLVILDDQPEATLGLSASMIPFLEHNDPNRLLMGANMLRQALVPPDPEPALIQTGNEPDTPDFWCGRNLLTAFVSWGEDTFADGIVISESCAQRLNFPYPAEPGDKLSNRHGTKGVVSRILPDAEMPHLLDGTPVEIVFSFIGLHTRGNLGQLLEAQLSRIAHQQGSPILVPPFHSPGPQALQERLSTAGLPELGLQTLTLGADGPKLELPSVIGWVYWLRLAHLSRSKVMAVADKGKGQMQAELENIALFDLNAYQNVTEYLNTRAARREDAGTLAQRLAAGPVEQSSAPTPMFADLQNRLRAAGLQAVLDGSELKIDFQPPTGDTLTLAHPLPHPWLHERELTAVGVYDDLAETTDLAAANERLARMLSSQTPGKLIQSAVAQLETRLNTYFDVLLQPGHLRFRERQLFSGRAVITPAAGLNLDQVALPDEIVWTLFTPLVVRALGDADAVQARSQRAAEILDEIMADSWVIINRAPTITPTALLAFHPVRDPGNVIRIHPLVCELLNADFDGDQVAIMLPITAGAQREAGERLSVAAHLARDPDLLISLLPPKEALWGLARLCLSQAGRQEINQLTGVEVAVLYGVLNQVALAEAMHKVLEQQGVSAALESLERLTRRGFAAAQASGASMSTFIGADLDLPPKPPTSDPDLWEGYLEEINELLASSADYHSTDLGPQLLAAKCRSHRMRVISWLVAAHGVVRDIHGNTVVIESSLRDGLSPDEMFTIVAGARQALAKVFINWDQIIENVRVRHQPGGMHLLARARRSKHPGIVFARAAATGEIDPLTDIESRLLVGLPVKRN